MLIDGKAIAAELRNEFRGILQKVKGRPPCLAVMIVGDDPASHLYVNGKEKACKDVGIHSIKEHYDKNVSEEELLSDLLKFNQDPEVDGILVQLPLPPHIDTLKVTHAVTPEKDVDGFHPVNVGKMLLGEADAYLPCTPLGIKVILEKSGVEMKGKHAVVVGRSNIVGKPMAALLMRRGKGGDATVTIAHRHTPNLGAVTKTADILISAVGIPGLITKEMVKPGAVVIDVGMNRIEDANAKKGYRVVGDVAFDEVKEHCSMITPVPGGVGPLTITMLLYNTIKSYKRRTFDPVDLQCLNTLTPYS